MKKKVLIFIEDGSFSYDNRVKREAATLVAAGWDVTVISPKYPQDSFYRRLGDRLRSYHYPKPTGESLVGHVVEHSISFVVGTVLSLWVAIRHGFLVFHACNPLDILWMIALPYKLVGKRFIFDQHDLCPELYLSRGGANDGSLAYRTLCMLERQSYRHADVVIATNMSYRDVAISRGRKRPETVFVVRNGPDLQKFRLAPAKAGLKSSGETLVGYLGNMNPQDGVEYLLLALKHIIEVRNRKDIRVVLIGGGSSQASLAAEAVRFGLRDFATFTGRIPDDDMLATLAACDICVQPDPRNPLNEVSTMNKVMEYMALGKPVVSFDLKETRVSCGDAALYAAGDTPADLAEKIIALADNPSLRERMGVKGRERVETTLTWQVSEPHLIAAYDLAIDSTKTGR